MPATISPVPRKRKWLDMAILASIGAGVLVLSLATALGLTRPVPSPTAAKIQGRGGIICPKDPGLVDAERLQTQIDTDITSLAARLPGMPAAQAQAELEQLQLTTCQFVLQNPRRSMAWVQLLSVSPQAVADAGLFSQLYQKSFDLGRLQVDAARGRINLAAPRWPRLASVERQMLLSDARTVILAHTGGLEYPLQLAREGIKGGPQLRLEFRNILQEIWPDAVHYFDDEEARILSGMPKS